MWAVLRKFQLGEAFIKMIQILYANPSAMVNTNGLNSRPFPIFRGTRQGCGLSPSLFILSLELFTQHLRQNSVMSPIQIRQTSHTLSAFADDVLIYMTDIENSINSLLVAFEDFKQQSGFIINWTKSALMLLNEAAKKVKISSRIPVVTQIAYLGIQIHPSIQKIVKSNYERILKEVERDLANWTRLPASLQTRISVVKMNILSRVNFLSMMIPLSLSPDD